MKKWQTKGLILSAGNTGEHMNARDGQDDLPLCMGIPLATSEHLVHEMHRMTPMWWNFNFTLSEKFLN